MVLDQDAGGNDLSLAMLHNSLMAISHANADEGSSSTETTGDTATDSTTAPLHTGDRSSAENSPFTTGNRSTGNHNSTGSVGGQRNSVGNHSGGANRLSGSQGTPISTGSAGSPKPSPGLRPRSSSGTKISGISIFNFASLPFSISFISSLLYYYLFFYSTPLI